MTTCLVLTLPAVREESSALDVPAGGSLKTGQRNSRFVGTNPSVHLQRHTMKKIITISTLFAVAMLAQHRLHRQRGHPSDGCTTKREHYDPGGLRHRPAGRNHAGK